MMSFCKRL